MDRRHRFTSTAATRVPESTQTTSLVESYLRSQGVPWRIPGHPCCPHFQPENHRSGNFRVARMTMPGLPVGHYFTKGVAQFLRPTAPCCALAASIMPASSAHVDDGTRSAVVDADSAHPQPITRSPQFRGEPQKTPGTPSYAGKEAPRFEVATPRFLSQLPRGTFGQAGPGRGKTFRRISGDGSALRIGPAVVLCLPATWATSRRSR